MTIYRRILISYLCVCLIPLALSFITLANLEKNLQAALTEGQNQVIASLSQELDQSITEAEKLEELFLQDTTVAELCNKEYFGEEERIQKGILVSTLSTIREQHQNSKSAFVFFYKSGQVVSDLRGYEEDSLEAYSTYLQIDCKKLLSTISESSILDFPVVCSNDGKSYLVVMRYLYSSDYKTKTACAGMLLPLNELLYDLNQGTVFLFDQYGGLLYGTLPEDCSIQASGNDQFSVSGHYFFKAISSSYSGLNYGYITDKSLYNRSIYPVRFQIAIELVVYVFVGIFLSMILSKQIYLPYGQILQYMKKRAPKQMEHESFKTLENGLKLFEQEQMVLENKVSYNKIQLQNTLISGLLSGYSQDLSILSQYLEDGRPYRVFAFYIDHPEKSHYFDGLSDKQKADGYEMFFYAIKNVLDELILEKRSGITLIVNGLAVTLAEISKEDFSVKEDIEKAIRFLNQLLDISTYCFMSNTENHLSQAALAYSEAVGLITNIIGNSKDCPDTRLYEAQKRTENLENHSKAFPNHPKRESMDMCVLLEIQQYVQKEYHDVNLNVSAIADRWNLPLSTLSRKYRAQMGHGLLDEIHLARLREAHILLSEGKSVRETSEKVGYIEPRALVRAFKRYEGIVPSSIKSK